MKFDSTLFRKELEIFPELSSVLESAGWNINRKINPNKWINDLINKNYSFHELSLGVLSSLGGLNIEPPQVSEKFRERKPSKICFIPKSIYPGWRFPKYVQQVKMHTGLNVSPIGELDDCEFVLLLSNEGALYTKWEYLLFEEGSSLADGLDNILFGRRLGKKTQIPLPTS